MVEFHRDDNATRFDLKPMRLWSNFIAMADAFVNQNAVILISAKKPAILKTRKSFENNRRAAGCFTDTFQLALIRLHLNIYGKIVCGLR